LSCYRTREGSARRRRDGTKRDKRDPIILLEYKRSSFLLVKLRRLLHLGIL
jgi:hypothetical protein